jgi:hypothetical protein
MTMRAIWIKDREISVDTDKQIETAKAALEDAGEERAPIYVDGAKTGTYITAEHCDDGFWLARGSEAESEDRAAGHTDPISDEDLASDLAYHYTESLEPLGPDARSRAVDLLVQGYRKGG